MRKLLEKCDTWRKSRWLGNREGLSKLVEGLSSAFTEWLWILYNESGIFIRLKSLLQYKLMVDEQLTWPSAAKCSLEMICSTMCHLSLSHLCKHSWVQGFAHDNIHSGCCSDKSGHLWDRRDDGYSVSSSINGVRLLHACLLPSLTQRKVSPTTQQLTNNSPSQVFTAFPLRVTGSKYINKNVPAHLRITQEEKS